MLPKLTLPQTVKEEAAPVSTIAVVLDAALDAHRAGTLDELLRRRTGALRWITRHFLQPILGTAGDALPAERPHAAALELLLKWGITQLRPDRAPELTVTDRQAWLERTSWRPTIAVMCHYSFAPVPDFRDRYYRHPDESPADNLCGLWNVGQSTFYRYLDKGKRLMAKLFYEQRLDQRHSLSLRNFVSQAVYSQKHLDSQDQRVAWHHEQVSKVMESNDYLSALWHLRKAHRFGEVSKLLLRYLAELANHPELDQHLNGLASDSVTLRERIELQLAQAAIHRARHNVEREQDAYERAVRVAVDAHDNLGLGLTYQHLGKFYETRDADRAFAYYRDSIELLTPFIEDHRSAEYRELIREYVGTLAKLAWQYALRNDPRANSLLNQAEQLSNRAERDDSLTALIEQVWGEYHRRAGNIERALEHKLKALSAYERIDDQQGIVTTFINLGLIYEDLKRYESAISYYARVLALAKQFAIDPYLIANTHLNLGACCYWLAQYDVAIGHYDVALQAGEATGLNLVVARSHYNLAEAYYARFKVSGNRDDEHRGDVHVSRGVEAYKRENYLDYAENLAQLKSAVLHGAPKDRTDDRLLPQETAAHFPEMAEVAKHRAILAAPGKPEDHVRAHLAVANAYLAISAKEREQALALVERHGLGDQFAAEFEQLRATFTRELAREQRLAADWKRLAGEMLSDERRAHVLSHLFQHGSINKSGYAKRCNVGLATASKHLVHLAEIGLLKQIGKGPSTRYVLP